MRKSTCLCGKKRGEVYDYRNTICPDCNHLFDAYGIPPARTASRKAGAHPAEGDRTMATKKNTKQATPRKNKQATPTKAKRPAKKAAPAEPKISKGQRTIQEAVDRINADEDIGLRLEVEPRIVNQKGVPKQCGYTFTLFEGKKQVKRIPGSVAKTLEYLEVPAEAQSPGGLVAEVSKAIEKATGSDDYDSSNDPDLPQELVGCGLEVVATIDNQDVHRVFVDGDEIGCVQKLGQKRWQVVKPASDRIHQTRKAAIETITG